MSNDTRTWVPIAVLALTLASWLIAIVVWWNFGWQAGVLTLAAVWLANLRGAAAERLPSHRRGYVQVTSGPGRPPTPASLKDRKIEKEQL